MSQAKLKGRYRGEKSTIVLDSAFLYSTVCVNKYYMSIFITLSQAGVFFYLGAQSASPSLLAQRSCEGIVTSYFFVRPLETTTLVRKLEEKKT